MRNELAVLAASLTLLSNPAAAGDRPAIGGKWIVDATKSDFGPNPIPTDLLFDIRVEGEEFYVKQTGGGQAEIEMHFNTSGKEMTNEMPGARMTSTHRWEGSTLVGELKVAADDGSKVTFKDRITYSPDGKVMTMKRDIIGLMGADAPMSMTIVMNR